MEKVSEEDLEHLEDLAMLNLKKDEKEKHLTDLINILDFADIVCKSDVSNLDITISGNNEKNVFRKDEIKEFKDINSLMQNTIHKDSNMYKVPRVVAR